MRRIIRWATLEKRIPFTRQHILRLEKSGRFPKRVQLGANAVGWFEDEIDAHMAQLAGERDELNG